MKNTPLTEKHTALGAKMAEFAGYKYAHLDSTITEVTPCRRDRRWASSM
jgi:glycine cleavage system aminomethyltransferase T